MDHEYIIDVAAGRKPADLVLAGGKVVNVLSNEIIETDVAIAGERIAGFGNYDGRERVDLKGAYICPGFIDGHVHIESSMLSVSEFARAVSPHGTCAVIADPHEIANVMGMEGIRFILRASKYCPVRVYVMLSSCVPASHLESAGAELSAIDLLPMLKEEWVLGLAEMMNFHAVVAGDEEVLDKLRVADDCVIDGHAPGLSGRELMAYVASGIRSDHECTTLEEAREKLRAGMTIMIREGSHARDLDSLLPLVTEATSDRFIFVTDDKHVDDLLEEGQIDCMVRRAIQNGLNPILAIKIAGHNAANYFGIKGLGAVAPGHFASLAILEDLKDCRVLRVYKEGQLVAEDGVCIADPAPAIKQSLVLRSSMNVEWLELEHFALPAEPGATRANIIELLEEQVHTDRTIEEAPIRDGFVVADPARDLCKVAVVERHQASGNIGIGLVRGFGLKRGALASSVAHDAHNLCVVGTNDEDIFTAAVHLVKIRGGLCVVEGGKVLADVPLPIAGLLAKVPARELAEQIQKARAAAAEHLECKIRRPFMAMSFLTLSVIGSLKLTDQGLIDVDRFEHIPLLVK